MSKRRDANHAMSKITVLVIFLQNGMTVLLSYLGSGRTGQAAGVHPLLATPSMASTSLSSRHRPAATDFFHPPRNNVDTESLFINSNENPVLTTPPRHFVALLRGMHQRLPCVGGGGGGARQTG